MISDLNDDNLIFLSNLNKEITKRMEEKSIKRIKSLTMDSSLSIEYIYNGLIDICRCLLSSEFNFIIISYLNLSFILYNFITPVNQIKFALISDPS